QIKVAYNMHHVKNAETIATLSECYVTESGRRKEGLLVNERSALNILLMYARCLVNEFTEKSPELPFLIYLLSLRLDGTRTLFYGDHDLGIKGMRPELDTYFSVNDHKPALSFLIIENFINGLSYAAKAPLLLPASEEVRPLLFWLTKIYNAVFISENNFMPAVDTTIKNTPILFILRQQLQALAVSVMESISTDVMLQEKKNTGEMLQAIDLQLRIIIKFAEDHRINIEKEDIVGLHEEFQELSRKLQPLEEFSVAQFRAGLFFLAELRLPAPELFRRNAEELFVHVQNLRRSEKFLEVEAMVSELHDFHIEYKNSAGEEFSIGIVSAKRSLQNLIALCHQLAMASSENKLSIASILYHAKQTDVGIILPMYFPKIGDHSLIYKHKTSNRTLDAKQLLDFLESVIPQDVKLNTGRLNLLSLFQCHFLRVSFDVYSSINIYSIRITNGERPAVENWDLVKAGLQKSLLEIIEMLLNQGLSGLLDVQGLERKSVDLCRALTKLGVSINNCDPAFGAECQNVLNIKDFKVAFRAVSDELKQLPAALALKN
ncbi:MAG: hypothetical protein NTU49_01640, partial [Gammaproteobacteria bacterium]|nr:hypothetical protein [Gammaproteobacteria bacterium]